ncbi:PIN domain-containing protein [Aureimonas mangrovi]|uniref:PIN domain-containing protein n=1 Tax=Aureimonas mangrovi TaxID=2758041 RepID=UPI001FEAAAAE|nr:PIN domain-containing protein [Aureimonas mangrovi]
MPAIVVHELFYGAFRSERQADNLRRVEALQFEVLDLDREDAFRAGQIRARLADLGTQIGPYDILIAGQALARDFVLVTRNTREFERVEGLRIEDWES